VSYGRIGPCEGLSLYPLNISAGVLAFEMCPDLNPWQDIDCAEVFIALPCPTMPISGVPQVPSQRLDSACSSCLTNPVPWRFAVD
jgi:hypothetical protein